MTQHGEAKPEHNRYTGCPQEGTGMECQDLGGVRRVFMQRGSLWHGKSEPKQERKASARGERVMEEMGDELYSKEMIKGTNIISMIGARFLWKGRKLE